MGSKVTVQASKVVPTLTGSPPCTAGRRLPASLIPFIVTKDLHGSFQVVGIGVAYQEGR